MFILLFSDSHGNVEDMKKTIESYENNVDIVIHLGDYVRDVNRLREEFPMLRIECVAGNNDWISSEPVEKVIELEGKKFFLTHGHTYNVKANTTKLVKRGNELKADVTLFGHTHLTDEFFDNKMLVINPGSVGRPSIYQASTYCELRIDHGKTSTVFKSL